MARDLRGKRTVRSALAAPSEGRPRPRTARSESLSAWTSQSSQQAQLHEGVVIGALPQSGSRDRSRVEAICSCVQAGSAPHPAEVNLLLRLPGTAEAEPCAAAPIYMRLLRRTQRSCSAACASARTSRSAPRLVGMRTPSAARDNLVHRISKPGQGSSAGRRGRGTYQGCR